MKFNGLLCQKQVEMMRVACEGAVLQALNEATRRRHTFHAVASGAPVSAVESSREQEVLYLTGHMFARLTRPPGYS